MGGKLQENHQKKLPLYRKPITDQLLVENAAKSKHPKKDPNKWNYSHCTQTFTTTAVNDGMEKEKT